MKRTAQPGPRPDAEDRLILLAMAEGLGACTEDQLMRFAVEADLIAQFRFLLLLSDLREDGLIEIRERPEGRVLVLTSAGRETLRLFPDGIRPGVRERIAAAVPAWRRQFRDERQLPASWEETDAGVLVTLRALEAGAEPLRITVAAPSRADAQRWCERWPAAAQEIYGTLIRALSEPDK